MDNQSIGRPVWFDNINIEHYNSEVLEENHYYPFGLTLNSSAAGNGEQPYKYQTKELEKSFGLEMFDFHARQYDPQLGRFNSLDPMAHERVWVSPYNFVQNNPVNRVDPTGAIDDNIKIDKSTGNVSIEATATNDAVQLVGTNGQVESSYAYGKDGSFKNDVRLMSSGKFINSEGKSDKGTRIIFKDASKAFQFFKFAAKSDVEFGFMELKGKKTLGYVSTSHSKDEERFGSMVRYKLLTDSKLDITKIWHSHPEEHNKQTNWPAYPSGFDNKGKIVPNYRGEIEWQRRWYPNRTPTVNHIFVPSSNSSIEYNSSSYKDESIK